MADNDAPRTVFAPNPGGRRTAPQAPAPDSLDLGVPIAGPVGIDVDTVGVNPLVDAAAELLELAVYLRGQTKPIEINTLRDKVLALIRTFERRALTAGEPQKVVTVARYAISATIDDVILSSPWGYDAGWQRKTLVSELHGEVYGGDKFFELLDTAQRDPGRFKTLIELMYVCLSLGFQGRYRREKQLLGELEAKRAGVYRVIDDQRGGITDSLSVRWMGEETTRRKLSSLLPTWLIGAIAAGVAALMFFGATLLVNDTSSIAVQAANAMPPTEQVSIIRPVPEVAPPPPPPPPPIIVTQQEKIRQFLEPEIADGLVEPPITVGGATLVRIRTVANDGQALFGSGRADVQPRYVEALERVARALNDEPGTVLVIGYSDNIPIRTARFPSNFELSLARATAVSDMMRPFLADPERLRPEGRGARDPIADNGTPEGRALNRRIELLLLTKTVEEQ
jgi:type VI secretion system protein ImpK